MRFQRGFIVALTTLLFAGCASEGADGIGGEPVRGRFGKGDGAGAVDGTPFTLIQAGYFDRASGAARQRVAHLIHYGFVAARGDEWSDVGDLEIAYDADGENLPVEVVVPDGHDGELLAYDIVFSVTTYGHDYPWESYINDGDMRYLSWTPNAYVDLANPAGTMVRFPVSSGAGYPFAPECYDIAVRNADTPSTTAPPRFGGKIDVIYYGFTTATEEEYLANNDVPWMNIEGELIAEGMAVGGYEHDGGYKGSMFMQSPWLRVPDGMNLVFKIGFNKYNGVCYNDGDTSFDAYAETQTYFMAVPAIATPAPAAPTGVM